jgi:alkaline phosphatase D
MSKRLMLAATSRRALLAGMAGAAGLFAFPGIVLGQEAAPGGMFRHSVASGDPAHTSVVLWTRVTGSGEIEVEWELSDSLGFERIVKAGKLTTGPERDHTVKLLATGLEPGGTWYFRFRAGGETSPVGRARTLARGKLDRLGIALASCSNYAFGFFNAYDAIAADPGIDFVLHTGDYIYEYGDKGWGAEVANKLGRVHEPANEIVSLADYRQRHAQYKSDSGSRAMHAAHTLISCWDDHESTNNPWSGGAQNHQPQTEGDWAMRRAASVRAYFEWMPVREPEWLENSRSREQVQFWRSYSFGDLATMVTLETRHTARAKQIDYGDWFSRVKTARDADKLKREVLGKPGRRMLAPDMEADLADSLARSVTAGQPWRLIGNPMPIAKTNIPDFVGLGILPEPQIVRKPDGSIDTVKTLDAQPGADLAWKGKWNLPFYEDTWDGYPWAREQLYALSRNAGAGDLVFLTGDSHSFWANQLADDAGRPAGIELGTSGISSPGDFIARGFSPAEAARIDRTLGDKIEEVTWTSNLHQGYVRVTLTRDRGEADFIAVSTVLSRDYFTRIVHQAPFVRKDGSVRYEAKA